MAGLSFLQSEVFFKIGLSPTGSIYDLYCFWKQVRDYGPGLVNALIEKRTTATDGRALFEELTKTKDELCQNRELLCEFQRAVRFFVLNRITFSGADYL